MTAVFNECPACLTPTKLDQAQRGAVVAVYERCQTCNRWHWGLGTAATLAAFFTLLFAIWAYMDSGIFSALNSVGVLLTIFGGYLIFGKLELLLLMGTTIGGFHYEDHKQVLKRETCRARVGLILVIVGLLIQALP